MSANEFLKLWVVEYSRSQGMFHVYQVEDMLENNFRLFRAKVEVQTPDYIPLAFVATREEADQIIAKLDSQIAAPAS